jgi:hypothetical protein
MSNADPFKSFANAVHARYEKLAKSELFVVEFPDIFEFYLSSFPEGTNPIFRTRTYHDGSIDKQFIRNLGRVVAIVDGVMQTVWDLKDLPHPYDVVAERLDAHIRSKTIASVFRTKENKFGTENTLELRDGTTHRWDHFWGYVAKRHYSATPEKDRGEINTTVKVFERGLVELTTSAFDTVLDLIDSNAIYRGAEFRKAVAGFRELQRGYLALNSDEARSLFAWANFDSPAARFRNTAIGTLVTDLSDGVELEKAVRSFETKVAPENYKRPTALITQKMVDDAVATLNKLGLESAIERRFARLSDVSVNNVLFVDNTVRGQMKGGIAGLLADSVKPATVDIKDAEPISMEEFLDRIVPRASSIELLVENSHLGNFMSLTAPVHPDAGQLFKWNNGFAWSYDGEMADSMRQRVQSRGGRVDGVLRFTHQWNDTGRNASLMDLHVFMPGHEFTKNPSAATETNDRYGNDRRVGWNRRKDLSSGGVQDVDYTSAAPAGYIPVENITFPDLRRMPEGDYVMKIHNWALRAPTNSGFKAEIEFAGQVFQYEHPQPLKNKEWVTLAVVTLKNGVFSIRHLHPTTSSSQKKWGVDTQTLVPVNTLLASPNHWDGQEIGNKHWFFILKDCLNPEPTRGIYNEYLKGELEPHRKVFEVLGAKSKCPVTTEQLSGVGFSSTRHDKATVVVKGNRLNKSFAIQF